MTSHVSSLMEITLVQVKSILLREMAFILNSVMSLAGNCSTSLITNIILENGIIMAY